MADKSFIETELDKIRNNITGEDEYGLFVDMEMLKTVHLSLQKRIIIDVSKQVGISLEHKHIEMLLELANGGETGKTVDLPGGYAGTSYGKIYFKSGIPEKINFSYELKNGENFVNGFHIICENPNNHTIVLRSRQDGDKILAGGMHKKVKKILIDKKVPVYKRNSIGVITVDGEVAAIPGIIMGDVLKSNDIKIYCGGFANDNRY